MDRRWLCRAMDRRGDSPNAPTGCIGHHQNSILVDIGCVASLVVETVRKPRVRLLRFSRNAL